MTDAPVRVSPGWLALREPADAAARATDLVEEVRRRLPDGQVLVHDLGCGTGSMGRWLAPRLGAAQHWVLSDWDADLLALAARDMPPRSGDGAPVTTETRRRDVNDLTAADLAGAGLVTASALLDLMTGEEVRRWATTCTDAGCPTLATLTVIGRVELTPADELDDHLEAAFNAHQRRTAGDRSLLGPDAVDAAVAAFAALGAEVLVRPSPWRLRAGEVELAVAWLSGWLSAACEQRPDLGEAAAPYARRRLAEAAAGRLAVTVHHQDLLALPR